MAKKRTTRPKFSEQIRTAIQESELTRYEIAKRTGVDQAALSRFMSGERGLSTSSLDKLMVVLELEVVNRKKE